MPRAAPVTTITLSVSSIATSLTWPPDHVPRPWTLPLELSFPGLIVAGKKYLWKTPIRSFRRLAIANRITPHGRRGPRLQRAVSARNRVDWEALDGGRRQGTHSPPARFNQLLSGIPGISDRVLTERLRELESEGLV